MCEPIVILKQIDGLRGKRGVRSRPIDGVREVNIEIRDHRPSIPFHIRRRWKVGLLDILQLADQRLLRRTPRARIPLDRALVDHDCEGEAGMRLRFRHDELGGLVDAVVRAVPVDHDAVDSPADHVRDLTMNLGRVRGTIADAHVVRSAKPQQQVSVNLGCRAGIQQRVHINLAHIARARIAIRLTDKAIDGAGVIRRLCGQRRRGYDIRLSRAYTCRAQQQNCSTELYTTHLSSGAEGAEV